MANLPAEIAHLLEEIQAKDRIVQECRNVISARDGSIQKFLKANGAGQANPKEEAYVKNILANYEKARTVQEEKIALAERSTHLVSSFFFFSSSPTITPPPIPPATFTATTTTTY